jgi:hypothetical protein
MNITAMTVKPGIWMLNRPALSIRRIATMYPGMANTAKIASWVSVLSSSEADGLSRVRISGAEMLLP